MFFKKIIILIVGFLFTLSSYSQEKFTLSGVITDIKNNETLIGVNVYIPEIKSITTTNEYGFYSITLPTATYTVLISYIGFQTESQKIELSENKKMNFSLSESGEMLKEVIITDNNPRSAIRSPEMSLNKLSISAIKKMPVVLGEVDVLKSLLLLPGVTNAGEGASGFNVRGGGADQNLILLDEATIFNSSHVFGFFSVFNPDAIKGFKIVQRRNSS